MPTSRAAPKPIVVTPDEFVFKKPPSTTLSAPPTNIFLQNTTSSPFLVEIEDNSGLLEIVTKTPAALPQEQTQQMEERDEPNLDANPTRATATFQISAKGMIVVAIKYNPHRRGTHKQGAPEKSPPSKMIKKGIPTTVESSAMNDPHQAVSFRCTPMVRATESLADVVPNGETYMLETPFTFKEM
ncbi:hypothetical protein ON010_g17845 [Phytophthora cinnamomi]|nr:hypothetical protein ON010_g17845 [Phytophthora cinnamomi]